MLEQAVNGTPALASTDRVAALTLAEAYTSANARASSLRRDDPEWQAVVNEVNAKDARMNEVPPVSRRLCYLGLAPSSWRVRLSRAS
ncbi:hypothetical protein LAUMK142_03225 [Mycobacterium pseudokansasii]|uniref:Uncharacterized protein n=2 Tax=Mycobacterium pseudokansasii TaxID=2341080 RepID=A0A498QVZ7_9MYCO|nr:hypothetical protein LAUMK142_03225 [Mycobacterium pseudokansasii]